MNPITPVTNTQSIRFADFIRIRSRNTVPNDGSGVPIIANQTYTILYVGTTNFITYGAASNTVGVSFVANSSTYIAGTGLVTEPITYAITSAPYPITVTIDETPVTFQGLGYLVKAGDATRDIKSTANETTFTLTGVDSAMLSLVLGAQLKGSQIEAWHGFFNADGTFIYNLIKYSNNFSNSTWFKVKLTSLIENTTETADPQGTYYAAKVILNGNTDPQIGQWYETGESIVGKTYTFSIWAKTAAGQPTGGQLFIYDSTAAHVGSISLSLSTSWQRFVLTYTFPVGTAGTGFYVRYDPPDTPSAGNYVYIYGASLQAGSTVSQYIPTTSSGNNGLYKFFTGYVNSYGITEDWSEDLRQYVATISLAASSIQIILRNRVAGRYTNDASWQFFNAGDESMMRVAYVSTINFPFGKQS